VTAIRQAGPADAPVVVDVLCRAFDADPVIKWVVRQDGGRAFRVGERHLMGGDGPPLWLTWRDPA
jgi:hypothetical protein